MCAICGILDNANEISREELLYMMDILKHRGPDDKGSEILSMFGSRHSNVAVGFDRLSIRDLSETGHQPMWNYGRDIFITFNGEIYNSEEIRQDVRDYQFQGTSDTEVLLYLYERYGIDKMLEVIDGMFAICIVDVKIQKIFLIRDRLGEKPLYLYRKENVLMWASEYKAFYASRYFCPELNHEALTEYLMFRYVSDGETLLQNVTNMPPGTYYEISAGYDISRHTFWTLGDAAEDKEINRDVARREINHLLDKSVRRRLISDVPVGLQLSGGVDSSLIAEYASRYVKEPLKTFGITFDGRVYSEEEYMRYVSGKLGTDHSSYGIDEEFLELWKKTTWYFEAPMNQEGTMGLLYLNKRAKEKVTVMLCGEGADEVFGGYQRFSIYEYYRTHPISGMLLYAYRRGRKRLLCPPDLCGDYIRRTQFGKDELVKKMFDKAEPDKVIRKRKRIFRDTKGRGIRKYMNYEIRTFLQDNLMRADKVSMASSVELRVPFLMPELVDYACRIPSEYFVEGVSKDDTSHSAKIMIKQIAEEYFDKEFVYRPKMGFFINLYDYFMREDVSNYIEEVLLQGILSRGVFNYDYVSEVWSEIKNGSRITSNTNDIQILYCALSFEMWAQIFLDGGIRKYIRK